MKNLENLPEKAQKKLIKLKLDLEEIEKKINYNSSEIEKKLPIVKEETEKFSESFKTLDAELGKYTSDEDKIAGQLALEQEKLCNLRQEETTQKHIYANLCDCLAQIENDYETKLTNFKTSKEAIKTYEKQLEKYKPEKSKLIQEKSKFEVYIKSLRVELENRRKSTEQFQSSNRLLKALMDQKKNNQIKGLYGRLGDLGAIDQKYDIAISTTCPSLDNIVVDSVETAQLCIKFLQKENLGVASFIALDKQQHFMTRMQNKPKTPENAPRLFDLIQVVDEKVLPAFYYALNDTLVANDIAAATRISMGGQRRWRTVTLKGEVVETSGAMTGGGNTQKKGKIGQNVKVITNEKKEVESKGKDLKELRIELEEAEKHLNNVYSSLNQNEKNFRDCETELVRTEAVVKNLQTDLDMLKNKIKSLKDQVKIQEDRVKKASVNQEEINKFTKKIDELKQESDKLAEVTNELRIKKINLTEKINEVNNKIIGSYQEALHKAETEKLLLEKTISKENNAIVSNERSLKKSTLRKTDLENDLTQLKLKIKDLEELNVQVSSEKDNLNNIVEQLRIELDEAEKAYNDFITQSKEINKNEVEIEKRLFNLNKEVESTQLKINQNQAKIKLIDAEIAKFKLYNIDDFPVELTNDENEDNLFNASIFDDLEISEKNDEQNKFDELSNLNVANSPIKKTNECKNKKNFTTFQSLNSIDHSKEVNSYSEEQIRTFNLEILSKQLKILEERKAVLKKENLSFGILLDYFQRLETFNVENKNFQNISKQRDLHSEYCERLKKQRLQEFLEGFQIIGERLKEMYQMITLGGDASLDLVDSLDPFNEGVSFMVRPPKKSWKQITNLSGGEKTLASLALVFGLHHYRPSPFYVMDEIDAALDFRNVSIISSYILQRTKNAQFIVISLRNNMFERGDRIVGIYKVYDCTYNVVLNPKEAEKILKKNLQLLKSSQKRLCTKDVEKEPSETTIIPKKRKSEIDECELTD